MMKWWAEMNETENKGIIERIKPKTDSLKKKKPNPSKIEKCMVRRSN